MTEAVANGSPRWRGETKDQSDGGEHSDGHSESGERLILICEDCGSPYIGRVTSTGIVPAGVTECTDCGGTDLRPADLETATEGNDGGI